MSPADPYLLGDAHELGLGSLSDVSTKPSFSKSFSALASASRLPTRQWSWLPTLLNSMGVRHTGRSARSIIAIDRRIMYVLWYLPFYSPDTHPLGTLSGFCACIEQVITEAGYTRPKQSPMSMHFAPRSRARFLMFVCVSCSLSFSSPFSRSHTKIFFLIRLIPNPIR